MAFEELRGLGSGIPQFPDAEHRELYNTSGLQCADSEVAVLIDIMDELLCPEAATSVRAHKASSDGKESNIYFNHEYTRGMVSGNVWPLESVKVSIDHTRMLGRSALKQIYAVHLETKVHQVGVTPNSIVTKYYIQEFASSKSPFTASILRPDILTVGNLDEECMTPYDCEDLGDTFTELMDLTIYDIRDGRLARPHNQ